MPQRIGRYEILGPLGSGAFGRTYKARRDGRLFALKALKPEAIRSEVDLRRFQRECRALQKITSENVVRYHDQGVFDDEGTETFYLVMSFVEGVDLHRHLKGKTFPIAETDIRAWAGQVLAGLAAIHGARLVHRDLKPSNIFLGSDGKVQILDFGLVKMLDYTTITMTGGMVGTPLFMSPEEMLGKEIDHRSDLYSFGVLLFHLLTGTYPLTGENHLQLVRRVTQDPPARPGSLLPTISNRLENLILRLLEKEPYLRPADALEVKALLERTAFYVEQERAPVPTAQGVGFESHQCWIRLLPNEKAVVERVTQQTKLDGVVFQANYLPTYRGHLELLKARGVPCILDPSTNRLAYSKFTETAGLRRLPYVLDQMNRLTPARLGSLAELRRYVRGVLDWQIQYGCSTLVAPFHFSRDLGSAWIRVDLKLFAEARDYLASKGRDEKLFAGVCVNIEQFTDEESRKALVNTYSRNPADGYLFYVDPINERTSVPAQVFSYLHMLLDFKELGRPVIAGRIGNLGLGALALGIDAFETGIASLTFFTEEDMLRDRPTGYTMQTRYYLGDLLACPQVEAAIDILGASAFRALACPCRYCQGRRDASIGKTAKEHFLVRRAEEIAEINALPQAQRMPWFLRRTENARKLTSEVERKAGVRLPSQHFRTWLEVLPEVAKRSGPPTRTL